MRRHGRFLNPGRLTNYEMGGLRAEGVWRRQTRWSYMWASVSHPWHPISQEHWQQIKAKMRGGYSGEEQQ